MRIELRPGIAHDLTNDSDFYREQAGRLVAQRFLDEFERITRFAVSHPELERLSNAGAGVSSSGCFPLR